MLRNEVYTGVYYQNTQSVRKPTEYDAQEYSERGETMPKRIHSLRPRDEWIAIEVPSIVSREVWLDAQQILDEGKRMAERKTSNKNT